MNTDRQPRIHPRPTVWRHLDIWARLLFPGLGIALCPLVLSIPLGIPAQAALIPAVTLISVFAWSILQPAAMSAPIVFLVGLMTDLFGLAPLGVTTLTLLTSCAVMYKARAVLGGGFGAGSTWIAFILVAACAAILQWALVSVLAWRIMPTQPALFQFVLTAALYPALASVLGWTHRHIAGSCEQV